MKVSYHDLSQHVCELYNFFDIYAKDVFRKMKMHDNEIAVIIVFPTDSPSTDYEIEVRGTVDLTDGVVKIVDTIRKIAEELASSSDITEEVILETIKKHEELEELVDEMRVYDVSEYDQSLIFRISPKI